MQIKLTNDAGDKFRVFWQPPRDIEAVPAVSEGWRALWVRSIAPALLARMTVWTSLGAGSVTLCAAPAGSIEGLSQGGARDAVAFLLRLVPGADVTAPAWVTEPVDITMNGRAPGADA